MKSPAFQMLPENVQNSLSHVVKDKFAAYFAFTSNDKCKRALPSGQTPDGKQNFIYPDISMIPDLMILWSLFSEVYQLFPSAEVDKREFFAADTSLQNQIHRIIKDGEFWDSPNGLRSLREIPLSDAVPGRLEDIWKTLRNGYAHFHWCYENLSALDYWKRMDWDTAKQQMAFHLESRVANNYMAYIADAKRWNGAEFWDLPGLRIIVVPYPILRYHLHLFLNILLNGDHHDVFGNDTLEHS